MQRSLSNASANAATAMGAGVSNIRFQYDAFEDRLRLLCELPGKPTRSLMFTRRLALRLVNGFAKLLERKSWQSLATPTSSQTNSLVHEHFAAVAQLEGGRASAAEKSAHTEEVQPAPAQDSAQSAEFADVLISHVDVQLNGERFNLTFFNQHEKQLRLKPTRAEMHRMLAALLNLSEKAGWNISVQDTWLSDLEISRLAASGQTSLH